MPMIMPTMTQAARAATLAPVFSPANPPARDPATRLLAPLGGQAGQARPDLPSSSPPAIRRAVLVDPATGGYLSRAATHHRRVMTPLSRDAMTFATEGDAVAWQATADGVAGRGMGDGSGGVMEAVSLPVGWFGLA